MSNLMIQKSFLNPRLNEYRGLLSKFAEEFFQYHDIAINLYENKDEYLILVNIAGFTKEDIHLSLHNPYLDILITKKGEGDHTHKMERRIHLEEAIEEDSIGAKIDNGILRISLKKGANKELKTITIES